MREGLHHNSSILSARNFGFLLCLSVIPGCAAELKEVCSHPVGSGGKSCCAIGTLTVGTDQLNPKAFSCRSSLEECEKTTTVTYPGFDPNFEPGPDYEDNGSFNSGCSKTKWEDEPSFFTSMGTATGPTPHEFAKEETVNCLSECAYDFRNGPATGDPGKCPTLTLNADIPGALFQFYASIDPNSYPDPVTAVPIASIAKEFHVPESDLKDCPRSDVYVNKDGSVQNLGPKDCNSIVRLKLEYSEEKAQLTLPKYLAGNVTKSDGVTRWMEYLTATSSFSLKLANPVLSKIYNGSILRSGMLYDAPIAEILNEKSKKVCVRAKADLGINNDDNAVLSVADEAQIAPVMQLLVEKIAPILEDSKKSSPNGVPYPAIAQATLALDAGTRKSLVDGAKSVFPSFEEGHLLSMASWMDAGLCHKAMYPQGKLDQDYLKAFETVYLDTSYGLQRTKAYEKLLRCAAFEAYVSPAFGRAVEAAIKQ